MRFKEYINEGEIWDALCHGVKTGIRAFKEKRQEQKKEPGPKALLNQMVNAEGKDLESLIQKAVENGFTAHRGKLEKRPIRKNSQWLLECTVIKKASNYVS